MKYSIGSRKISNPVKGRSLVTAFFLLALAVVSGCSDSGNSLSSGSGESGVGGTGISFVRGNVVSIDDSTVDVETMRVLKQADSLLTQTTVSGGGRSTTLNASGEFVLENISTQGSLVLEFRDPSGQTANLNVGAVGQGVTAVVSDVEIRYASGQARAASIRVTPNPGTGQPENAGNADNPGNIPENGNEASGCNPTPGSMGCSEGKGNPGGNGNGNGSGSGNGNGNGNGNSNGNE